MGARAVALIFTVEEFNKSETCKNFFKIILAPYPLISRRLCECADCVQNMRDLRAWKK